jgi:hypothetical protein
MSKHLLTKSAYVSGLNCEKYLWVYLNERERLPEPDESTQALFDQGHEIGKLAKSLYPDGIEIDWGSGHDAGIAQTRSAIRKRKPVFEAGFQDGMTHARADILKPASGGEWELIEVKSSAQVKEEHLDDVAFQKHVYEAAGIRVGRCSVMHVDKTYVRRGKLDVAACSQRRCDRLHQAAGRRPAGQDKKKAELLWRCRPGCRNREKMRRLRASR